MRIRQAEVADAQEVARLIGQLGYPAPDLAVQDRLERLASSTADRLFVAERGSGLAGLAALHISLTVQHDARVAKLAAMVGDDRFRGRGVGRALVAAVEEEARRRECGLIFVNTAERRGDAQAFYRAIGYEETGRRFAKPLDP
jgi:N-acetylglutamate synthase-like GNAT family acetyltransferase